MKFGPLAKQFQYSMIALILMSVCSFRAVAQNGHSHTQTGQDQEQTLDQRNKASALLQIVRESTERFKDVSVAEKAGYHLMFGCVSGPDAGAMGLHYVNLDLVGSGVIDPRRPQIVIYEQAPDGRLKLTGADFLVMADQWNAAHGVAPPQLATPQLMGQLFHLFETPNRFGLPAFYTLHVWAWKENPNGAFVNWHPNVSCQSFTGPTNN
jgi:hypothetical protein